MILNQYRTHSHLMAVKDDLKVGGGIAVKTGSSQANS